MKLVLSRRKSQNVISALGSSSVEFKDIQLPLQQNCKKCELAKDIVLSADFEAIIS
jgi:hypothetical protein